MSDLPIPDDLVAIARRIHMTQFDDADLCDCADDELLDADTLAALAEWADGALIDPNGWRRLDARRVWVNWCPNHEDAADQLDTETGRWVGCADNPEESCTQMPLHTLTERADQ